MNKVIGITGIIGSGKTTLTNLLKQNLIGYKFIDVDIYRKKLLKENQEILDILNIKDIKDLNSIIYKNKDKMNLYKKYLYQNLINYLSNIKDPIILEWALLIDDGLDKYCDYVFILNCSKKVIIERLKKGDLKLNEIKKRISLQLPIKNKIMLLNCQNYQVIKSDRNYDIESIIKKIKEVTYEL